MRKCPGANAETHLFDAPRAFDFFFLSFFPDLAARGPLTGPESLLFRVGTTWGILRLLRALIAGTGKTNAGAVAKGKSTCAVTRLYSAALSSGISKGDR